jgi:hypothetical protein
LIGSPKQYFGAQVGRYFLPDNPTKLWWYLLSKTYVKKAIRKVKDWMKQKGMIFKTKVSGVFPSGYRAELDVSELCDDDESEYYQQQIGVLRWAVELGRIDITVEILMLAAYMAAPQKGHFRTLFHLFAYLDKRNRSKLVFNNNYVKINDKVEADWKEFYLMRRQCTFQLMYQKQEGEKFR